MTVKGNFSPAALIAAVTVTPSLSSLSTMQLTDSAPFMAQVKNPADTVRLLVSSMLITRSKG
jgi:hypothetical protein